MLRISDVLTTKSTGDVVTVLPTASIRDLVSLLGKHNIGAVVVSQDGHTVAGIVSERDIVRHLTQGAELLDMRVNAIMTSDVRTVTPEDSVQDTRQLMTEHRIRHLPVVVDGELCGLVSIGDIVKSHIEQVEYERDQLDSYISS